MDTLLIIISVWKERILKENALRGAVVSEVFPLSVDGGAQHNLFVPRPNTEALKKSFSYRGAVSGG